MLHNIKHWSMAFLKKEEIMDLGEEIKLHWGGNYSEFARAVGLHRSQVSRLVKQGGRVNKTTAEAIESATNGRVTEFDLIAKARENG